MRAKVDSYKHKGLRQQLIKILIEKGITDTNVLKAIDDVPRHFFLESALEYIAYEDRAFPISAQQTISHPYTVAYQTQLLQTQPKMKVLEIGTGSAYQACVLAALKVNLITIERQKELFDENRTFEYFKSFKNIRAVYGDGFAGLPTYAPFDRIIITAAAPSIPEKLVQQLKVGGIMVLPMTDGDDQIMLRITKKEDSTLEIEKFERFSFVPMLSGKNV